MLDMDTGMAVDLNVEEVTRHMVSAVEAAPLELDPFPYLYARNLLPDSIYEQLLRLWPKRELFHHTNTDRRWEFNHKQMQGLVPEAELKFWHGLNACITTTNTVVRARFKPHYSVKFEPYLGPKWEDIVGEPEFVETNFQCTTYTGRYGLPAHVDALRLVTNAFLYVSESDHPEPEHGTILYRSRGLALPNNWELDPKLMMPFLDPVAVSPYAANSCLAYINGPSSFHGVAPHDIGERERRLLMFGSTMYVRESERIFGEKIRNAIFR